MRRLGEDTVQRSHDVSFVLYPRSAYRLNIFQKYWKVSLQTIDVFIIIVYTKVYSFINNTVASHYRSSNCLSIYGQHSWRWISESCYRISLPPVSPLQKGVFFLQSVLLVFSATDLAIA